MQKVFSAIYTKEQLQQMWLKMTQEEISNQIGFSTRTIFRYIKKWNLQKRASGRQLPYTLLDTDTEIINYFGGFGYADGSLQILRTNPAFRILISKKDKYIIETMHNQIEGSKIYNYTDNVGKSIVGLALYGFDIPKKLKRFGITTEKRYVWTEPSITDDMLPHFLRGWFDGDGYIGSNKYTMILTNINKEAIEWFDSKIKFLGYTPNRRIHWSSKENKIVTSTNIKFYKYGDEKIVYRWIITGKENCKQIYTLLHGDSKFRLSRKWKLLE